jgi:hypothetical protein
MDTCTRKEPVLKILVGIKLFIPTDNLESILEVKKVQKPFRET